MRRTTSIHTSCVETVRKPNRRPSKSEFELTAYAAVRDPDWNVYCEPAEPRAVLTVKNHRHGELLRVNLTSPTAVFELARKLMESGVELESILNDSSRRR